MDKNLSRFYEIAPGSDYELKSIESDIDANGDLREVFDADVIVNSIIKLLSISKGTYLFDPNFGVGIHKYIFEPADLYTKNKIESEVKTAIAIYETRARIDVNISFLSNVRGFKIEINVEMGKIVRKASIDITDSLIKSI